MKNNLLAALTILVLLAVAAPSCLAAENSTSDQQPAPQYSKLPPLHFSGSTLAQKEYPQAFLWMAQSSGQASTPKNEDEWLGISTTKATVLSSIAALIAAIMAPVISIFVARKTMTQTRESLEDDFTQRKREQKNNFKFQLYQLALEEKKKLMINFFELTSIPALCGENYSPLELQTQLTMIEMLMNKKFYDISNKVFSYAVKAHGTIVYGGSKDPIRQHAVTEYKSLHADLANEIRRVLSGAEFDPTLTPNR
ncbi:hypothetical protein JMF94_04525 [Desulfovibrio sp. UIB00]|uniref:hypothetical protein n=1 Tax=Desulfovibrio sp. UIB00 TaxID=2804314 RepID=UPI001F0FBF86|nr:hypothetical protein [Desulfovibrio sp. UIB00]MCH5144345.1 hypothetical protein [Desulfovibrio sp. UIB00]